MVDEDKREGFLFDFYVGIFGHIHKDVWCYNAILVLAMVVSPVRILS